jgi:hypothetical protein
MAKLLKMTIDKDSQFHCIDTTLYVILWCRES